MEAEYGKMTRVEFEEFLAEIGETVDYLGADEDNLDTSIDHLLSNGF